MADIDEIIKGLGCIAGNGNYPDDCPCNFRDPHGVDCENIVASLAISLLKEQQKMLGEKKSVKPKKVGWRMPVNIVFEFECECGTPIMTEQPFCMKCGKKVIWCE